MYPLTENPNLRRTDTAAVFPDVDWGKEMALFAQYAAYSRRGMSDKSLEAGKTEMKKALEFKVDPNIVQEKALEKLHERYDAYYQNVTEIYHNSGLNPSPKDQLNIKKAQDNLFRYHNELVRAHKQYNTAYEEIYTKGNAGGYDIDYFLEQQEKFLQGEPIVSYLMMSPESDVKGALAKHVRENSDKYVRTEKRESKGVATSDEFTSYPDWDQDRLVKLIENWYDTHPRQRKGIIDDFLAQPEEVRRQFAPGVGATYEQVKQWAIQNPEYLSVAAEHQTKGSTAPIKPEKGEGKEPIQFNKVEGEDLWTLTDKKPFNLPVDEYYENTGSGLKKQSLKAPVAYKQANIVGIEKIDGVDYLIITTAGGEGGMSVDEFNQIRGSKISFAESYLLQGLVSEGKDELKIRYLKYSDWKSKLKALNFVPPNTQKESLSDRHVVPEVK